MPELPEVQAAVDFLNERVRGHTICRVTVLWHRTIADSSARAFEKKLPGFRIEKAFRRGKFIGIHLVGRETNFLFIHLRMSGSLDVISEESEVHTHDRVVLDLSNSKSLRFNDPRKFGRMYLHSTEAPITSKLGLEPLSDSFTLTAFREILQARRGSIKSVLLNQNIIAGLGNIYVDEALWAAGIHPQTPSNEVTTQKTIALRTRIQKILREAIALLGTDFGDGVVEGGMYRPKVYGRQGGACKQCGNTIQRIVVGQRGTHICPFCQRYRARKQKITT
jgi:formamidopyrimidine-DNA glycosylase